MSSLILPGQQQQQLNASIAQVGAGQFSLIFSSGPMSMCPMQGSLANIKQMLGGIIGTIEAEEERQKLAVLKVAE